MKTKLRRGGSTQTRAPRGALGALGVVALVLTASCAADSGRGHADSISAGGPTSGAGGGSASTTVTSTAGGNGGEVGTSAATADNSATAGATSGVSASTTGGASTTGALTTGGGAQTATAQVATSAGGASTTSAAESTGATMTAATTTGATTTGATGGGADLVPAEGALLGVFTPAQSQAELVTTESQIGRSWALHLGYFDWSLDYTAFAAADIAAGRTPYITVEPFDVPLDAIANGSQDSVIQNRASGIQGLGGQVLLRFAHEMNGDWYPWGGAQNGADSAASAKYVAAYRHVHDVFAAAGVTNVLWVFCPNVDSVPADAWNDWENYYPGDAYVDWMCYDGYNWATDTFASMTSRIYSELAAKNKPIMLGETSTHDVEKASWIQAILPALQNQFPMVRALVWFHVNKEEDWRYDSSADSLAAFVAMANDPYFNP